MALLCGTPAGKRTSTWWNAPSTIHLQHTSSLVTTGPWCPAVSPDSSATTGSQTPAVSPDSSATTGPQPPAVSPASSRRPSCSFCKCIASYSTWLFYIVVEGLVLALPPKYLTLQKPGRLIQVQQQPYRRNNDRAYLVPCCHTDQLQNFFVKTDWLESPAQCWTTHATSVQHFTALVAATQHQ